MIKMNRCVNSGSGGDVVILGSCYRQQEYIYGDEEVQTFFENRNNDGDNNIWM